MIVIGTGLYISFCCLMSNLLWVSAHLEAEEWEGGIVSHEYAQGGVEIGLIPLA